VRLKQRPGRHRRADALALAALAAVQLAAAPAWSKSPKDAARGGTLAVVNLRRDGSGHELTERAARQLRRFVGGWARQPGISALLGGRPNPGALPVGITGQDLVKLVDRVRAGRRPAVNDLAELGKLLGVDYLLLLAVKDKPASFTARLFSTHGRSFAPQELRGRADQLQLLRPYVQDQTRPPPERKGLLAGKSWWIWAIAAGLAAVTIGLAVSASDDSAGDLRIRVSR